MDLQGGVEMEQLKEILDKQRRFFATGKTKNLDFRIAQLEILREAIISREPQIMEALKKDLNKDAFDSYTTEIGMVLNELTMIKKNLAKWDKPKKKRTPLIHFPASSHIYNDPYGLALIISPWNYPFQLAFAPLIGAVAAGNCAVLKPSEFSYHTSLVIESLVKECFDEEYITVICGEKEVTQKLLEEKFNYIFFTGSVPVGRIIMSAAAKHLTPVTLELGGKSPCIVDETADLALTAKRIVWGKFMNAGQICVAPDYILVDQRVKKSLIGEMKKVIVDFYGKDPHLGEKYPKIINEKQYQRLVDMLVDQDIIWGGGSNKEALKIEPTLVDNLTWDNPLMEDEIFGPILPILEFQDMEEVVAMVNQHPKPLALYLFTKSKRAEELILRNISFGGGCINDVVMYLVNFHLPFGGVGDSGMGAYHGKYSYETFSHQKSILKKSNILDIPLRYPTNKNLGLAKIFMK